MNFPYKQHKAAKPRKTNYIKRIMNIINSFVLLVLENKTNLREKNKIISTLGIWFDDDEEEEAMTTRQWRERKGNSNKKAMEFWKCWLYMLVKYIESDRDIGKNLLILYKQSSLINLKKCESFFTFLSITTLSTVFFFCAVIL